MKTINKFINRQKTEEKRSINKKSILIQKNCIN